MRIELTIKSDYVSWGLTEGLRELLQNARDAAVDTGEAPVVTYDPRRLELRITNPGATLEREALLLGFTTKRGQEQYAGQFGEGLKLGTIGVLNAGRAVEFVTRCERWAPSFVESRQFPGQRVLAFDVTRRSAGSQLHRRPEAVTVLVRGVLPAEYDEVKRRVRWLTPPRVFETSSYADILFDPEQRGRLYVKGLFVEELPTLTYGYDLHRADVDRDRKMVDRSGAEYALARAWVEVVGREHRAGGETVLRDRLYRLLTNDAADTEQVEHLYGVGEAGVALAAAFRAEHGAEAVACRVEELGLADSVGIQPVRRAVAPAGLYRIVTSADEGAVPTVSQFAQARRDTVEREYAPEDLTPEEARVFGQAVRRLRAAVPALVDVRFTVGDLNEGTRGLAQAGVVIIGRPELATVATALRVGAHEAAHALGEHHHGASHHLAAEEILGAVVSQLLLELAQAAAGATA